ncbi:MAG: hypothetical protein ACFCAD_16275 [Pleurocapsa sp.]
MKLISLCLIGLNALVFPVMALAESLSPESTNINAGLIAHVDEDIESATETESDDSNSAQTELDKSEEEKSEDDEKADEPAPEEIARLKKLATADQLYLSGYKGEAKKLYRQTKGVWELEKQAARKDSSSALFDDPAKLSPAGKVFWRNYQKGKKQQLESKVVSSLKLLTTREPQFISGHIHYAQMLQQYEREAEARKVLEKAASRYPSEPKLIRAKIDSHVADEEW